MRALSFALAFGVAAVAQAQTPPETPAYRIDDNHVLTAQGLGWKFVDLTTGKEKNLILPAFHPEQSRPVLSGQHMAYISLTKHGDRQQLGCVTFDLTKGKVVNRKDSSLFAKEGERLDAPAMADDGAVNCRLKGEQCDTRSGACNAAEEDVALNFVPGAVAGKPLKGAKGSRGLKGSRKAAKGARARGARKAGKATAGGKRHATHKAGGHKSKPVAKKAKHQ